MSILYEPDGKTPATCKQCPTHPRLKFYYGALGYEAFYCPTCGYYTDHKQEGQSDTFKEKGVF